MNIIIIKSNRKNLCYTLEIGVRTPVATDLSQGFSDDHYKRLSRVTVGVAL